MTEKPEVPNPEPIPITYPSPFFKTFDPNGLECPVCHTKAPVTTVRFQIPGRHDHACQQFHKACWEVINVMRYYESKMTKNNVPKLIVPPSGLILPH